MSRALAYISFFFIAVVCLNFALISIQGLFKGFYQPNSSWTIQASNYGLKSIDFNLLEINGSGKSFITQGYGNTPDAYRYPRHWHNGIDIAATYNAPVYAASAGKVLSIGNQDDYCWHRGFGKYVAIQDNIHNLVQWYAHLGTIKVSIGQSVVKETELGTIGTTGYETGPHLHFSIFDLNNFNMTPRNGCGPDPTGQDRDPIPFLNNL